MVYWKLITALEHGMLKERKGHFPCLCFTVKSHLLGESDERVPQYGVFSLNHWTYGHTHIFFAMIILSTYFPM